MSISNNAINTPKLTLGGQLLIGSAAGNPIAATLTPGTNITITNSNGGIQISSSSSALQINQVGLQYLEVGSTTYTPSAGTLYAFVQVLGGGGGGGGATNSGANDVCCGSGGGGGGYTEAFISIADIGASQTITVGAGGIGVSTANGTDGSPSSIGTLLIGNGGDGGTLGEAEREFIDGGSGGGYGGSNALYGYAGQSGGNSGPGSNITPEEIPPYSYSGFGGGCFTGRLTEGQLWSTLTGPAAFPGINTTEYGCAGTGGLSTIDSAPVAGGNGWNGFVLITEYIVT